MKATALPIFCLVATALACGVPPGAACTKIGQTSCEFNGGHTMYCSVGRKWEKGMDCPNAGKKCLCETGACGDVK
ncbi:hypothetical protein CSOJ01_07436 [Colletotrichum sojae]|uniref:Uncharacterized protein n=1 Tax=Colletotrichum sojae TaxID=2175907 RepID=A0A8H6J9P2_9PEZI|nr:hypothetical protein CSOJ01_07436 [Colletotrichum sojae]